MNFQDEKDEKKKDEKKRGKENGPEASDIAAHRQGYRLATLPYGKCLGNPTKPCLRAGELFFVVAKLSQKTGCKCWLCREVLSFCFNSEFSLA